MSFCDSERRRSSGPQAGPARAFELHGIQYLRAFAAISVLMFHAVKRSGGQFEIGAAGVDIFFVISGAIMQIISTRRPVQPLAFMADRISRIVPPYWFVSFIVILGTLAGLFPKITLSAEYVFRSLLFIPAMSPATGDIWPIIVQGWTLNFEMFFYGLFAVSLLFRPPLRLAVLSAMIVGFVTAGLLEAPRGPIAFTFTRPLLLEFLAGVFIGELWNRGKLRGAGVGMLCLVAGLGAFAVVFLTGRAVTFEVTAAPAALVVLGTLSLEGAACVPRFPIACYLGDASFSIYLWHSLAIAVSAKLASIFGASSAASVVLHVLGGILVGSIAYELVERQLNRVFRRQRQFSRPHLDYEGRSVSSPASDA